jgi:hypothetical protein
MMNVPTDCCRSPSGNTVERLRSRVGATRFRRPASANPNVASRCRAPSSRAAELRSRSSDAAPSSAECAAGSCVPETCNAERASRWPHAPWRTVRGAAAFAQASIAFAPSSIAFRARCHRVPASCRRVHGRCHHTSARPYHARPERDCGRGLANAFDSTAPALRCGGGEGTRPAGRGRMANAGEQTERQPNITRETSRFRKNFEDSQEEDAYKCPSRSVCMVRGRESSFARARRAARPALSVAGARGTRA